MKAKVERICGVIEEFDDVYSYDFDGEFLSIETKDAFHIFSGSRGMRKATITKD